MVSNDEGINSKRATNTYTYLILLVTTKLEVGIFWSRRSGSTIDLTRSQETKLEGRNVWVEILKINSLI
jgi:hypothetical protein